MPGSANAHLALSYATDTDDSDWLQTLLPRLKQYTKDDAVRPLKPTKHHDRSTTFATYAIARTCHNHATAVTHPSLELFDGTTVHRVCLDGTPAAIDAAERLLLPTGGNRRLTFAFDGARTHAHRVLHILGVALSARGYTISVVASGGTIRALRITRERRVWWLCDASIATGSRAATVQELADEMLVTITPAEPDLAIMHRCLAAYQIAAAVAFGVCLRPTVGMMAMRAFQAHWQTDAWLYRPHPLLDLLCRAGGGYRGGYVSARRYRGPSYHIDITRTHSAALLEPIGARGGPGLGQIGGVEYPGIFLCRVQGTPAMPAYISVLGANGATPERCYWRGGRVLTVLPQTEYAGLRALGLDVTPLFGWRYVEFTSARAFVERALSVLVTHGRNSVEARVAKALVNAVVGKFGESPERLELRYATEDPGEPWSPALGDTGDPLPCLWAQWCVRYKTHQHVDVAASVTGWVRSRLYSAFAAIINAGGTILASDTDGILCDIDPRAVLDCNTGAPGSWRYLGYDADTVIAASRQYMFGTEIRTAGIAGRSADIVRARYANGANVSHGAK